MVFDNEIVSRERRNAHIQSPIVNEEMCMNTQAPSAKPTVDFSKSSALALAKAGWKVERVVHKAGQKLAVFVGPNEVKEERPLERGKFPALEAYVQSFLPKTAPRPVKKVLRTFGSMRLGKTARDHASRTRGSNPTGHNAIRGPQKGASGGKNKGGKGKH